MTLKGEKGAGRERLSYRTLDVEQIGSVYETVMGFTVETAQGRSLAIKAGKNNRTPVFVALEKLLAQKAKDRIKFLKEHADRTLTASQAKPIEAASTVEDLAAALDSIVDERGSPRKQIAAFGAPILQPTDERRRTGSHYTPRSLTEPIVRHALEPAFERLGPDATPDQILDLKVCDPAMGSGAFLVEACRALAARLVESWGRWRETRPVIPADEDEELHARRLVAQRCLYGVDKNLLATDLAKLSLWLATLARDHEFTFLDHALKSGDSLVGLTQRQIAAANWDESKPGLPLFRKLVAERVKEAMKGRAEIQQAPDDVGRAIQEARHRSLDSRLDAIRTLGDATISAFFLADKPKAREKARQEVEGLLSGALDETAWEKLREIAVRLKVAEHPLTPFHWEIEFPEVFTRENDGFDAIVGNPPFLGGKQMPTYLGPVYCNIVKELFDDSKGAADLCAYFFRRAFDLLKLNRAFGLIATNTISETATRRVGLDAIKARGGDICRAVTGLEWPGEATVTVCLVHVFKGNFLGIRYLNHAKASIIRSTLSDSIDFAMAERLRHDVLYSEGVKLYDGGAFVFPAAKLTKLRSDNPGITPFLRVYVNGDVLNDTPDCSAIFYVVDFGEKDESEIDGCSAVIDFLKRTVFEARKNQKRQVHEYRPWLHWDKRADFFRAARKLKTVIATTIVSSQYAFHMVNPHHLYAHGIKLFADDRIGLWGTLQSRLHEAWSRSVSSTLGTSLRYTTSSCFDMFPFSAGTIENEAVALTSDAYLQARTAFLQSGGLGTTRFYGRFHLEGERGTDIARLRELHADMDRAVLRAYGWDDLAERAAPIFLDESNEDDHTYQGRLFWPSDFRDEVLARLLALNTARAAAQHAAGLTATPKDEEEEFNTEVAAD
jgi:hypothetical protein